MSTDMMEAAAITRRGLLIAVSSALALWLTPPFAALRRAAAEEGGAAAQSVIEAGDGGSAGSLAEPVSPALMQIMCSHCAAYAELGRISKRTDAIALGHAPAPADLERLEEVSDRERNLFMQLCRYPASNDAERQEKATYLLALSEGDEFEREHVEALLASMGAMGGVGSQPLQPEAQSS